MVNGFTEKARHEVIENLLSAQHKTAEVTNIRAIGDKKDWQTLINTMTDDCFVLELTGACIGEWWEHEDMVFDDRDDVIDLLMSDGDMSEREAEATVDSLPHGECIWLLMDYAPL